MSGTNTIKSKSRQLLLGFKFGIQACAEVTIVQDVPDTPDDEENFVMIVSDGSDSPNTLVFVGEDGAEGTVEGADQ